MTKPLIVSASSLKTFGACPRKWAFAKIEGLEDPPTPATALGQLVHGQMENWVQDAKKPTHPIAVAMLKHAPAPRTAHVEREFGFEVDGVRVRGFMDIFAGYDGQEMALSDDLPGVLIGDYKTTSAMPYALRPETEGQPTILVDADGKPDPQSVVYAYWAFQAGAKRVWGRWIYATTKGDLRTKCVEIEFDRARVETLFAGLHVRATQMTELYAIRPKANDIPYRSSNCYAFRRLCPFSAHCQKPTGVFSYSPLDLDSNQGTTMTDFLSKIRTSFPTAAEDDAPPPPPPEDDDAPPPPPPEDDAPPPPPVDVPHPAERIALEYARRDQAAMRDVGPVESGFVNPPEAAGKTAYATPAEAAEGEGVAPVAEKPAKPKKGKGKKVKIVDEELKDAAVAAALAAKDAEVVKALEESPFEKALADAKAFRVREEQARLEAEDMDAIVETVFPAKAPDPIDAVLKAVYAHDMDVGLPDTNPHGLSRAQVELAHLPYEADAPAARDVTIPEALVMLNEKLDRLLAHLGAR